MESIDGQSGPVGAGDMGDGEEGTPIVQDAVVDALGHLGLAGFDFVEMVFAPAGELASEFEVDARFEGLERDGNLAGFGFDERDADGAVVEGAGKDADAREGDRGKGAIATKDVARAFTAEGIAAFAVAGVDEAAQFVRFADEGVEFVDEEGGLVEFDDAEQDGGGDVFGAESFRDPAGEEVEGGGFAATAFGGEKVQARGDEEGVENMGVSSPKNSGDRRAVGQDDGAGDAFAQAVQEAGGVGDGFGPGFELGEVDGIGEAEVFDLGADAGDFFVEGDGADAEVAGFLGADAVVVGDREEGEAGEGGIIGIFDF